MPIQRFDELDETALLDFRLQMAAQARHWASESFRCGFSDDKNELHRALCTHLVDEVMEANKCVPWELHKQRDAAPRYSMIEEMVDIHKFNMNLMALHDVTPEEFVKVLREKSIVVQHRVLYEEFRDKKKGPLMIVDLDGVLCDRDQAMRLMFPELDLTRDLSVKNQLDPRAYERLKVEFFQNGGFKSIQPTKFASAAMRDCKAPILILTSRDRKKFPGIEYQTIHWLNANGITYGAVRFSGEKDSGMSWIDPLSEFLDDEGHNVVRMSRLCAASQSYRPEHLTQAVERINQKVNAHANALPQS